jgi:lysozyme family protein
MSFEEVYAEATKGFEGLYANDPDDSGGETYRGVSRRSHPTWPGWPYVDAAKTAGCRTAAKINKYLKDTGGDDIVSGLVRDLFKKEYWGAFEGSPPLPEWEIEKAFDTSVHIGQVPAKKMLQQALNKQGADLIIVDGKLGPASRAAAQRLDVLDVLSSFCILQEAYYRNIVLKNPKQKKFLAGWLTRAAWIPREAKAAKYARLYAQHDKAVKAEASAAGPGKEGR